jgi:hypothetical protein
MYRALKFALSRQRRPSGRQCVLWQKSEWSTTMFGRSSYNGAARLDGKTAIVTGSNTGIGKCTVLDFVKRGELTFLFAA